MARPSSLWKSTFSSIPVTNLFSIHAVSITLSQPWCESSPCLQPAVTDGVPASALHQSLCTAAVYLVKGGCEERGWLCHAPWAPAKCLAPRLTGQDNSFPVVLENYSSEGVFTRRPLLILGTVFIATCSIKASNGFRDHGCVAGTCVCVCLCESSLMAVSSVSKSAILSIINISEPVSVLANLSLPSLEHSHTHLRHK